MTSLIGMILLTFRELWAKKIVMGLFIISTLVLLLAAFALNLDVVEGSLAGIQVFGQEAVAVEDMEMPEEGEDVEAMQDMMTLDRIVLMIESAVAGATYWIGILLALFAVAPLFTSLLQTGHIDLLLSKPMSRLQLISGHTLGVWLTMLILGIYLLGGLWLIMSIKTGVWNFHFLLSILVVVAMFAVMYAPIVLLGVWTQSTALSLIVTYGLVFLSMFLAGGEMLATQLGSISEPIFWGLYHTLPNFTEVTATISALAQNEPIDSWYPLISSLLFGAAVYAVGVTWFVRRDF